MLQLIEMNARQLFRKILIDICVRLAKAGVLQTDVLWQLKQGDGKEPIWLMGNSNMNTL